MSELASEGICPSDKRKVTIIPTNGSGQKFVRSCLARVFVHSVRFYWFSSRAVCSTLKTEEARISKWQYLSTRLQWVRFQDAALSNYRCVNLEFRMSLGLWFTCSGPSGRAVWGVGLRPLACWDSGFESNRGHGCLLWLSCVVSVVVCDLETSWMWMVLAHWGL